MQSAEIQTSFDFSLFGGLSYDIIQYDLGRSDLIGCTRGRLIIEEKVGEKIMFRQNI